LNHLTKVASRTTLGLRDRQGPELVENIWPPTEDDVIKLGALDLVDRVSLLDTGQFELGGIGGALFIAPFPRGLCFVRVRLLVPPWNRHRHHMVRVAIAPDNRPDEPKLYTPPGELIEICRPEFLRDLDYMPVEVIFNLNAPVFKEPGHYVVEAYCDTDFMGSTKFELRAP